MPEDKSLRRPLIDPLRLMLRSRRVLIAVATFIVALIITLIPDLASLRDELFTLITTLALALIGGYSLEDAASSARLAREDDTLQRLIEELREEPEA